SRCARSVEGGSPADRNRLFGNWARRRPGGSADVCASLVRASQGANLHERATADGTAVRATVRALLGEQRHDEAWRLLRSLLVGDGDAGAWELARTVVRSGEAAGWAPAAERQIRLAVLRSY